jgi:hypothetical protein
MCPNVPLHGSVVSVYWCRVGVRAGVQVRLDTSHLSFSSLHTASHALEHRRALPPRRTLNATIPIISPPNSWCRQGSKGLGTPHVLLSPRRSSEHPHAQAHQHRYTAYFFTVTLSTTFQDLRQSYSIEKRVYLFSATICQLFLFPTDADFRGFLKFQR